jgi:hypothetical protein
LGSSVSASVVRDRSQKIAGKIESAVAVLPDPLAELDLSPEHLSEKQLLPDALRTLDMIRRLELQDPGPIEPFGTAISIQVKDPGSRMDHCRN